MNFMIDNKYPLGYLPNGLTDKNLSEIMILHRNQYSSGELQNHYLGDFEVEHLTTEVRVKNSSFFDWNYNQLNVDFLSPTTNKRFAYVVETRGRWGELFNDDDYNLFKNMSPMSLDSLKHNPNLLVINYMYESITTNEDYVKLYRELEKHEINPKKIILITGDLNGKKHFEKWNIDKTPINIWISKHLFECSAKTYNDYEKNKFTQINDLGYTPKSMNLDDVRKIENKIRPKYFLSYNKSVVKSHRQMLLGYLNKNNLLEKGLVSCGYFERGHIHINDFIKDERWFNEVDKVRKLSPLILDVEMRPTQNVGNVPAYGYDFIDHYKDTYFTIVTESQFVENLFITAATCKPIGNLHPFIVLGRCGLLKYLKDLGFKTFDNFIDESYDEEEDDEKRFFMVMKEIQRLCDLPIEEIHKLYYDNLDTLLHNKKVLLSYSNENERELFFKKIEEKLNY